jgi:hypothetical protein
MVEIAANAGLKELVAEASQALARIDAERLEELARYCESLIGLPAVERAGWKANDDEPALSERDTAMLARMLQATRENLQVMRRLHELRTESMEAYGSQLREGAATLEVEDGND